MKSMTDALATSTFKYVHQCTYIYVYIQLMCNYYIMNPKSAFAEDNVLDSGNDFIQNISKYNPTLKNILKVEQLLAEYKEFDSKAQLAKKLDVTMRPPVLNVILKYLEASNKVLLDNDGSIIWIYASATAKKRWEKAVPL